MNDPLDYSPTIIQLQDTAEARCEVGPLDNPATAYREVKRQDSIIISQQRDINSIKQVLKSVLEEIYSVQGACHLFNTKILDEANIVLKP